MDDFKQKSCKVSDEENKAQNHQDDPDQCAESTPMHYLEFLNLHFGNSCEKEDNSSPKRPGKDTVDVASPPIQPHFNFPKKFTCDICKKGLRCRSDLRYHIRVHLFGRPFKCSHCELTYATKSAFKQHVERHALKCSYCPKTFMEKKNLAMHVGKSHPHRCNVCQLEFFYRVEMAMHFCASHNGRMMPSGVICTLCGVLFGTVEFGKHIQKNYQCRVCKQTFTCFKLYSKHRDEERTKSVRCSKCGMKVHDLPTHLDKKCCGQRRKCKFCSVKFSSVTRLAKHELEECVSEKRTSWVLSQCKFCTRSFVTKKALNIHLHKEHGSARCLNCNMRFEDNHQLAHHVFLCRNKRYRCILCPEPKVFSSRERCFQHLNFQHAQILKKCPFTCDRCKRFFSDKLKLLLHTVDCYSIGK